MTTYLLGISGALRAGSHNTALLREAARLVPALEIWDGLAGVPPFNEDDEHDPAAAVTDLRSRIRGASALVVATPEYNGSVPGQLKNALDWVTRPHDGHALRGKPVLVLSASPSRYGASRAASAVAEIMAEVQARPSERRFSLARAHDAFDATGRLIDPDDRADLAAALATVVPSGSDAVRSPEPARA